MQALRSAVPRVLSRLPASWLERAEELARRNSATSRLMKRLSSAVVSGPQPIAGGPAKGLLIDVADSRPSYILGIAEEDVQGFLVEHLRAGASFYDLGANVGYFSLVAARLVGGSGHVRAYEPLPYNAEVLRSNVARNALANVTVVEAAVSASSGEALFEEGPTGQDGHLGQGTLRVRTVTLDDEVADGAPPPTLVKLDIEGAEHDALRGARETLTRHRPVILCEMHADPWELDRNPVPVLLSELGYRVSWLEEGVDSGEFWAPHVVGIPGAASGLEERPAPTPEAPGR